MITDELLQEAAFEVDQAMLDALPETSDCVHNFSDTFNRKIRKLSRHAEHIVAYRWAKRVACILITLLLSCSAFFLCNTEVRAEFAGWIKESFEGLYHYFIPQNIQSGKHNAYKLDWLPDNYDEVDVFTTGSGSTSIYLNDAGQMLQFSYQHASEENQLFIGGDDYIKQEISIGNTVAEIYYATDQTQSNAILWTDSESNTLFFISGFLSKDELVKMAQNVIPLAE